MDKSVSETQTLLGFDFGTKRIGVAVGQTLTQTATPLTTLRTKDGVLPWQDIQALIENWHPHALVVGLPLNMDGSTQTITICAEEFAEELRKRYKIPVYVVDERLTTREARDQVFEKGGYRALKNREIDPIAAQIILEAWLKH